LPFDLDRYRASLTASAVGRRVEYREQTGSTMDDARALLEGEPGVAPGYACIAGEQLAGRGRLRRQWISAPDVGLYVTYYLRPEVVPNAPLISLAAALAVAEAAQTVCGAETVFKWPNDVMHDGRKLCGILAESRSSGSRLDVFLGIGVNVRPNPNHPPEIAAIAVSLEEIAGTAPAIEDLAAALSNALEVRAAQVDREPERVLADWRARLATLGQRVGINTVTGSIEGVAAGLGERGELVIELDDGTRQEIASGDVVAPGSSR
jgi:BirA family biotin operon repressor/biotin-[acetyl-CoA-carboxylase] ligase